MNVTQRTMTIAGYLIGLGASPNKIAENVFENKSYASQKLLGRALDSLGISPDGRVAWAHVSAGDLAEFSASVEDTEGIVNAIRSVRGIEVAMFLRETPTGQIRASLRARPPMDVSVIATRFGGGGHHLASGCTLDGPMEAAEALLVSAVIREMSAPAA
jgi:phosphoesterase RecJ-like protein